ncbi:MAG: hypothetical protein R6U40_01550 [Desulfobacterales bacterium]
MNSQKVVTPVDPGSSPGGVQMVYNYLKRLDSGFRRNDKKRCFGTFCETIKITDSAYLKDRINE